MVNKYKNSSHFFFEQEYSEAQKKEHDIIVLSLKKHPLHLGDFLFKNGFWRNLSTVNIPDECWHPVTMHSLDNIYQVSNYGRIKSLERSVFRRWGMVIVPSRVLKQTPSPSGYLNVKLCYDGTELPCKVHQIVAYSFHIKNPICKVVNHKNTIKWDNTKDNVEWATYEENSQHAVRNNLYSSVTGTKHGIAAFNEQDVKDIRNFYSNGMSKTEISKRYNVGWGTIYNLITKRTYKYD